MLKTKIICTLGPALDDAAPLRELIRGGMDVARMNFSHGSHEEHLGRLRLLRRLCDEEGAHIPVLLDTKGPEIRLGIFPEDVELHEGQSYTLTTLDVPGNSEEASISYKGLPQDVRPGNHILIDDGLVELDVLSVTDTAIHCRARNGGVISSRKSINVPGVSLNMPAMTEQDKADIQFAIEHDYDFIAVSFVRNGKDILEIRRFLSEHDGDDILLIAKIESQEGIDNLDEIIRAADGIMVARGDLGVEIPVEQIPGVQKDMIKRCYRAGKPVITATQMLDSMIRNPRPTRAEVTDVANAIYDGTSAIMLSGETAAGRYPVEALHTMQRVAAQTERSIHYWKRFLTLETDELSSITKAISHATCTTAMDLNAAAVVAVTTSGSTARRISSFRPACPIIAATTSRKVYYQLRMSWGVYPILADVVHSTDDLFSVAIEAARQSKLVQDGDIIVITAGVPVGISGTTNMLKVQMIGNILCRGTGIGQRFATGTIQVLPQTAAEAEVPRNSILVADDISDDMLPLIRSSAALILAGNDRDGQAATLEKALEIPVIVDVRGATAMLKTGTFVQVDAKRGIVQCMECGATP